MTSNNQLLKVLSQSLFGKITVKNVQNSHIWLMGVFLLFIVIAAHLKIPTWIIISFVSLLFMLVGYYIYRDSYFMHKHPEYLRSESLQLAIHKLEMGGEKGKEISAVMIEAEQAIKSPQTVKQKKDKKDE